MKINRTSIALTIIICFCIIAIPTYFNVKKDHEEKLLSVTRQEIESAAKKCFLDDVCQNGETSLKYLYDHKYLSVQINPVTKEYLDESSVISYTNKKVVFDFI